MSENKPLTPKQDLFVSEYLIDLNATQAYLRAFPKAKYDSARVEATRLLANPSIKGAIAERLGESKEMLEVTRERVLREYKLVAFASMTDFVEWGEEELQDDPDDDIVDIVELFDGKVERPKKEPVKVQYLKIKNSSELGESARVVSEISQTKYGIKLKLYEKLHALDKLAAYTKLIEEDNKASGNIQFVSKDELNG